ncbi:MAG TPA: peptidylprolyl isomerase [Mariprofundaceae bacterium]|nr:peptidylprolyl isomerase [Mariprofundaceae bacterium]
MKRSRYLVSLAAALSLFSTGAVFADDVPSDATKERKMSLPKKAPLASDPGIPEGTQVRLELDNGPVTIRLLPQVAPDTVANFKVLVANGFYDGLTFHRVIPGFMAQGGDPNGTGTGGPGYRIKAEFNATRHVRGTVAMARTSDPDSAGSQFYICYGPQPHLDGQYTVFGEVTEGMELIDTVRNGSVIRKATLLA